MKQKAIDILQQWIDDANGLIVQEHEQILIWRDRIADLQKPGLHPEYEYKDILDTNGNN